MLELVPNDPNVRAIATAMLGPLRDSLRTRGVYAIFPSREKQDRELSGKLLGPHNDNICQQLNVMCCKCSAPLTSAFEASKKRLHQTWRTAGRAAAASLCKRESAPLIAGAR